MLWASAGPVGAAAPDHTWTSYFYPLKVGWTCHESIDTNGIAGSETLTVASVGKVAGGRSVTVDEGSSTTVNGQTVPTNSALRYVLTTGGLLVSVPSSGQFGGQAFHTEGDTTYPAVQALLRGHSSVSRLQIEAPLSQSQLSQLGTILSPRSTSLHMSVDVRQSGSPVAVMHTPMGTFRDVLAVHSVLTSIAITNAVKAASKPLDAELKPIVAKEFANTTWYAHGIGPIRFQLGAINGYLTSCGSS